jgi:hypothetical protein
LPGNSKLNANCINGEKMRMKLIIRMIIITGLIILNVTMLNKSHQKTNKLKKRLIRKERELMASFSRYARVRQQNEKLKDINAVYSSQFNIKTLEQVIKSQILDSTMNMNNKNCWINFNNNNINHSLFDAELKAPFSDVAEFLVRLEQQYPPLIINRLEIEPAENFETTSAIVRGTVYLPK